MFKSYRRGFLYGGIFGAIWLLWVYWKAQQFPGDAELNRYYAWLRHLKDADPPPD